MSLNPVINEREYTDSQIARTYEFFNNLDLVKQFLKNNPDHRSVEGGTLLQQACLISDNYEVLTYLIDHDLDLNARSSKGDCALSSLIQKLTYVNSEDRRQLISKTIVYLLEKGADSKLSSVEQEDKLLIALLSQWDHPSFYALLKKLIARREFSYMESHTQVLSAAERIPDQALKSDVHALLKPLLVEREALPIQDALSAKEVKTALPYLDEAETVAERYLSLKYQPDQIAELEAKLGSFLAADMMGDSSLMCDEFEALEKEHRLPLQTVEALLRKNRCQTFIICNEITKGKNIVRFETSHSSSIFAKAGSYKKNFFNLRQCTNADFATTHLSQFVNALKLGPEAVLAEQDEQMKPIFEAEKGGNLRSIKEAIVHCHRTGSKLTVMETVLRQRKSAIHLIAGDKIEGSNHYGLKVVFEDNYFESHSINWLVNLEKLQGAIITTDFLADIKPVNPSDLKEQPEKDQVAWLNVFLKAMQTEEELDYLKNALSIVPDLNVRGTDGKLPLEVAVTGIPEKTFRLKVIALLIQHGAQPNYADLALILNNIDFDPHTHQMERRRLVAYDPRYKETLASLFDIFKIETLHCAEKFFKANNYTEKDLELLESQMAEILACSSAKEAIAFLYAIESCIETHGLTLQHIEAVLRKDFCTGYLFPTYLKSEDVPGKYCLWAADRKDSDLLALVLSHSENYQNNFDKLKDTVCHIPSKSAHGTEQSQENAKAARQFAADVKDVMKGHRHPDISAAHSAKCNMILSAAKKGNSSDSAQIIGYCMNRAGITLQQIEVLLRQNECDAYLLATPHDGSEPLIDSYGKPKKYYLMVTTRKEILSFIANNTNGIESYKNNFERLEATAVPSEALLQEEAIPQNKSFNVPGLVSVHNLTPFEQLMYACKIGDCALAENVLGKNPHLVNAKDSEGKTPLFIAVIYIPNNEIRAKVLRLLISHGAIPDYNILSSIPVLDDASKRNDEKVRHHRTASVEIFEVEKQVKTEAFYADRQYSISELAALDLMLHEVIRLSTTVWEDDEEIPQAITRCMQKYDLSLQQIEAHLRFRKCGVFVLGQTMSQIIGSAKYGAELLNDLTKFSKNYGENFDKLAHTALSGISKSDQHKFQKILDADKSGNTHAAREIEACIKEHKVTLQEIELNLRSHRCNCYLIAKPSEKPTQDVHGIPKKHQLWLCGSKQAGEIFLNENEYRNHFEKLRDTGTGGQSDDLSSTIPDSALLKSVYSSHLILERHNQKRLQPILQADSKERYDTIFKLVEKLQKKYEFTLEKIELFLRMKDGSAYLIAEDAKPNCKIIDLVGEKKYSLKVVNKAQAEEHFADKGISWSENLYRLNDTGWMVLPGGDQIKKPKPLRTFSLSEACQSIELSYVTKKEAQDRTLVLTFNDIKECIYATIYLKMDTRKWQVESNDRKLSVTFSERLALNQKLLNEFTSKFNHAFRRRDAVPQPPPSTEGASTDKKNNSATENSTQTSKKSDEGETSVNIPTEKKNTRKVGAKEQRTDEIHAKLWAKKREREALRRAAEQRQPRSSPRAANAQINFPAPKLPKPISITSLLTPIEHFLEPQASALVEDKRRGEDKLERLPNEPEAVITQVREKKKFSNEINNRIRSARFSLRDLADFRARVMRQEHDPKKAWVPLAYLHHLFQACEALQPTDKRKIEEREIDTNEQAFKEALDAHCLSSKEIFNLRNIIRSSFKITSKDASEVVEILIDKKSKHDKNIEDLLKELTPNTRNVKLSIEQCSILKRRWNLRNNPQRNLMLLRKIPGQLRLLKNTVSDCMQELEKFREFDSVENAKKFRILAFDHSAAIRMLFTRIGKLLARIKPFPGILAASSEIMDLRILANTNAHDIRKLLRGGGESESIPAKAIFQRLIEEDSTYLSNIEAAINKAIKIEENKMKKIPKLN